MDYQWLKNLARVSLPTYLCESDSMKIIYAGYSTIKKKYFVRFMLDGEYKRTPLGRKWFREISGLPKSGNFDLIISEVSPFTLSHFQKCNGFILPVWANMRINIDMPLDEVFERRKTVFSKIEKKIKKYNLTHEVLTDKESFNNFISNFYRPYTSKRYGDEALIEDLNSIWDTSDSPSILAIKENGIIVAESFFIKSGDTLNFIRLGLLDGNEEYLNHGAIGALHFFRIIEAQKMGCRYINPGGTRPFLTDGLTKNKMGLGAEFVEEHFHCNEYIWIGVNERSSVARDFIQANPFMYLDKDMKLTKHGR
jgi:hypothetical protein